MAVCCYLSSFYWRPRRSRNYLPLRPLSLEFAVPNRCWIFALVRFSELALEHPVSELTQRQQNGKRAAFRDNEPNRNLRDPMTLVPFIKILTVMFFLLTGSRRSVRLAGLMGRGVLKFFELVRVELNRFRAQLISYVAQHALELRLIHQRGQPTADIDVRTAQFWF